MTGRPSMPEPGRDSLTDVPGGVRLQKVLAAAGVGSRRHCEELIAAGRVEVDGEIVRRYGARVDPDHQIIKLDGRRIPSRQDLVYLALNKPPGVLTTMSDDRGRPTIADFLGDRAERLYHVGRLDYDTEGLMLLTNDGDLAHRLAHPRYGVAKTYLADVSGPLPRDLGRRLTTGIELEDGVASATGPTWVRTRRLTGCPAAASSRRTMCLRPSCKVISTRAREPACSTTRTRSALATPSSSSMPVVSRRPRSLGSGPLTSAR